MVNALDAGCGTKPRKINVNMVFADKKRITRLKNFVRCDLYQLPFQDKVFPIVYCSHALEHCLHPIKVLQEFIRVSKKYVEIRVPDKCYQHKEQADHFYSWTENSLRSFMKEFFDDVKVSSNLRIHGVDLISKLRLEGLIRLLRLATKHELVAVGKVKK